MDDDEREFRPVGNGRLCRGFETAKKRMFGLNASSSVGSDSYVAKHGGRLNHPASEYVLVMVRAGSKWQTSKRLHRVRNM